MAVDSYVNDSSVLRHYNSFCHVRRVAY